MTRDEFEAAMRVAKARRQYVACDPQIKMMISPRTADALGFPSRTITVIGQSPAAEAEPDAVEDAAAPT